MVSFFEEDESRRSFFFRLLYSPSASRPHLAMNDFDDDDDFDDI